MKKNNILIGKQKICKNSENVIGEYVNLNGEVYYKIENYDKMNPFLMSIVSNSDHWMYISSNGGLTAGRKNPDNALFPYYTDDIIHTSQEITGSKTILKINIDGENYLWEPFSNYYKNIYNCSRNIYKNIPGNKVIFEETNHDLNIKFQYCWMNSERFGFIKKSTLINMGTQKVELDLIDGIQNILPYGIYQQFQNEFSTLADGYKKNELIEDQGIGIYSLSSIPSDRAEPSESLKATLVWSAGIDAENYLLSSSQLDLFRGGEDIFGETDIKGQRGAYFIHSSILLNENERKTWYINSDINQDHNSLVSLQKFINSSGNIIAEINSNIEYGTDKLISIVGSADGIQKSSDMLVTSRHFSNVLFNVMRGGIFDNSYIIEKEDFLLFLKSANTKLYKQHRESFESLNNFISRDKLLSYVDNQNDKQLKRIFTEYLPLTFSRRHGDPSRPWNRFSIEIKNDKNEKVLNYQGNWRDVFQNWEALALSYPSFLDSMISKFLNASTADGYNPYRITRDGFDWEIPEPDKPWSNIGYWGDHQIIYLLKLLELSVNYNQGELYSKLSEEIYTYANVPYRIKSYKDLLTDPHDTITFDYDLNNEILEREKNEGTDARYLTGSNDLPLLVNMSEKLLVTLLSKLTNFIPDGGIWMNTQRPEWNDANNALVGNGISMVTLYYLRRYVVFLLDLFFKINDQSILLSDAVMELLEEIAGIFESNKKLIKEKISDKIRKDIVDNLGLAGEKFRNIIYGKGLKSKKKSIQINELVDFLDTVKFFIDQSINSNKREDGLYHSYNLISLENESELKIINLYEMLEGQVAILSSGYMTSESSIELIESLKASRLYRKDQNSYILYPNRELPYFLEKNNIPNELFKSSKLLVKLIDSDHGDIVLKDLNGDYHFNGEIRNKNILINKLDNIRSNDLADLVTEEESLILDIYEHVFNHKAFTGRSGTFYKYEGLGSIYWHMVSKLVLAVQENFYKSVADNCDKSSINKLKTYYYELKEGIGVHKSPSEYGAFPTDPYSHTPIFSGVQQPGMTGQVKEDIISRFGELGIVVKNNQISINTELLNISELLKEETEFTYYDVFSTKKTIRLKKNSLGFTYCQVPFIYEKSDADYRIKVVSKGHESNYNEFSLPVELSRSIFNRTGEIERVIININRDIKSG